MREPSPRYNRPSLENRLRVLLMHRRYLPITLSLICAASLAYPACALEQNASADLAANNIIAELTPAQQKRLEERDAEIAANPNNPGAYISRGFAFDSLAGSLAMSSFLKKEKSGKADWARQKAIEDFTTALRLDPKSTSAYSYRAEIYERSGQLENALNDYSAIIKLAPNDEDAYYKRGSVYYYNLKQPEKAIPDFSTCISLDPYNAEAYSSRALAYADLGMIEKAFEGFSTAMKLDPEEDGPYIHRATLYGKLGKEAEAQEDWRTAEALRSHKGAEYYSAALAHNPQNIGARYLRAKAFLRSAQYRSALDDLSQIIRIDPSATQAYYLRGQAWAKLKNFDKAVEDYSIAINQDPSGAQARKWEKTLLGGRDCVYAARASLLSLRGQDQRAIEDYSTAISLNPNSMGNYLSRGTSYGNLNNHWRALADKTEAIKLASKNPLLYESRGLTHVSLRQYKQAVDDFSTAIQLYSGESFRGKNAATMASLFGDPNRNLAEAYYLRGQAFSKMGLRDRAGRDFKQAVSFDPSMAQRISSDNRLEQAARTGRFGKWWH